MCFSGANKEDSSIFNLCRLKFRWCARFDLEFPERAHSRNHPSKNFHQQMAHMKRYKRAHISSEYYVSRRNCAEFAKAASIISCEFLVKSLTAGLQSNCCVITPSTLRISVVGCRTVTQSPSEIRLKTLHRSQPNSDTIRNYPGRTMPIEPTLNFPIPAGGSRLLYLYVSDASVQFYRRCY